MSLFHQETDSLLGGVSQLDPRQRDPSQVEAGLNVFPDLVDGLTRRPPTEHQAILDADPTAFDPAFTTVVSRGLNEQYRVVITGGDLKVFDVATDQEITVETPNGTGYLSGASFRAASFGGRTFLVNQSQEVATEASELFSDFTLYPEALVFVRQADYSTTYKIRVEGFTATHQTPAATNPEARESLDTQEVARELFNSLLAATLPNQFFDISFTSYFDAELLGSTIFIKRKAGGLGGVGDFEIEVSDGLADKGLLVVKDSVQRFEDLPLQARDGFVVRITGDPGSEADDQWVIYRKDEGTEEWGTWEETVKPGTPLALDASTMPHELVLAGPWTGDGTAREAPPNPVVLSTKWDTTNESWGQMTDSQGTSSLTAGEDVTLTEHDSEVSHGVPVATEGNETLLEAVLDVNTAQVDPSVYTSVILEIDDGAGTYTELDRVNVPSGENLRDVRLQALTTPTAGATVRTRVSYSTGDTPETYRTATVNMTAALSDPPPKSGEEEDPLVDRRKFSLRYATKNARYVSFGQNRTFPAGYAVTVTVEVQPPLVGDSFSYTPSISETGVQVAEALAPIIDADPDFQAKVAGPGVIEILYDDGSAVPDVSGVTEFYSDRMLWLNDLNLSGLSLVGATVENLSDGSTGTVTAHDDETIVVDDLTGGQDNTFQKGDKIRISGDSSAFVFKQSAWAPRAVGDLESNPFPEFVGSTIQDLTFYQGRLGFVWEDKVHFSRSGNPNDLMRSTALEFRPDDGFGVESAGNRMFHSAVEWDEDLYLVSDLGITLVRGEPILTSSSISMELVARVETSPSLQPFVLENALYVAREAPEGLQIMEIRRRREDVLQVIDLTMPVPRYLTGTPLAMVGSYSDGVILVVTSEATFLYRFKDTSERILSAWSKWDLGPGTVRGIDIIDGEVGLIMARPDAITLETITLST